MTRTINLLGSLEIKENDQLAPIMDSDKGCALLAYTIVTGQSQRREVLGDLLWEAKSTKQSLQNLRTLLHRIKKLLPELAITRSQISFQPTTELSVDFLTLTSALQQTETMQLDEALKLYRGDLLDGFYLRDAPRFNEWLSLAREQLR